MDTVQHSPWGCEGARPKADLDGLGQVRAGEGDMMRGEGGGEGRWPAVGCWPWTVQSYLPTCLAGLINIRPGRSNQHSFA